MENQVLIIKKKNKYSIQIWVKELSSWLVFDNFKSKKQARAFLDDEKEMDEVKAFIQRTLEGKTINENKNKAKISK